MALPPGHHDNDSITSSIRSSHGAGSGGGAGKTANDFYTSPLARSAALVLIDVQRDFLHIPGDDAPMPVDGTRAAIPGMAKLATAFRERGLPIVHTVRLCRQDGSNVDPVRRLLVEQGARIAAPGSAGSQIAAELLANVVELDYELLLAGG